MPQGVAKKKTKQRLYDCANYAGKCLETGRNVRYAKNNFMDPEKPAFLKIKAFTTKEEHKKQLI